MLYDNSQIVTQEFKEYLCDVLHSKENIEKEQCRKMIEIFISADEHLSTNEFSEILNKRGILIPEETIAVVFSLFSEMGFASEVKFEGEEVTRYEPVHQGKHHDHFVCIKCKNIIEFNDDHLENVQEKLMFKEGYKPLFHKLIVYGICNKCMPSQKKIMPITFIKEGTVVSLSKIEGGSKLKKRLSDLGFIPNSKIKVLKNSDFGPILLEIKDSKFAIGRGEAGKILVS